MDQVEKITRLRSAVLGLTGLVCVLYAGLAFAQGHPDPMAWWVPAAMSAMSFIAITASFAAAGRKAAVAATDELFTKVNVRAQSHAYWISLVLCVSITLLCGFGKLDHNTGFAVLGCLMGAAYLLLFVIYEWRMG